MTPTFWRRLSIKREQWRQARAIHGGVIRFCLAVIAVKLARVPIPSARLRLQLFRNVYARLYPPGLNESEADHLLIRIAR